MVYYSPTRRRARARARVFVCVRAQHVSHLTSLLELNRPAVLLAGLEGAGHGERSTQLLIPPIGWARPTKEGGAALFVFFEATTRVPVHTHGSRVTSKDVTELPT